LAILRTLDCPRDVLSNFIRLAEDNTTLNVETCGLLFGKEQDGHLVITTLVLPKQKGKSDFCECTSDIEYASIIFEQELLQLGWIHSHPKFDAFLSSVDLHQHWSYQRGINECIAIVYSPLEAAPGCKVFRISDEG